MSARKQVRNGKHASPVIKNESGELPRSKTLDELKTKLAAVYAEFRASRSHTADRRRREWFVLHMTDWLDDFSRLAQLYAKPNRYSDEEAAEIVAGALYHGVTHFTAAARLLLDYAPGDIFDAIEEQPTIAKS